MPAPSCLRQRVPGLSCSGGHHGTCLWQHRACHLHMVAIRAEPMLKLSLKSRQVPAALSGLVMMLTVFLWRHLLSSQAQQQLPALKEMRCLPGWPHDWPRAAVQLRYQPCFAGHEHNLQYLHRDGSTVHYFVSGGGSQVSYDSLGNFTTGGSQFWSINSGEPHAVCIQCPHVQLCATSADLLTCLMQDLQA